MIEVINLSKSIGEKKILDQFSMTVRDHAIFGLIGRKGAGKTTLFRMILGLVLPDQGEILIDQMDVNAGVRRMKRRVGYLPFSGAAYPTMHVTEYLEFFASCYDIPRNRVHIRIKNLLDRVGLSGKEESRIEDLSASQQKRVGFARALLHDPKLLLLDEPFRGLDKGSIRELKQLCRDLHEEGKLILLSSRNFQDISDLCTDIAVMDFGRLQISGALSEVEKQIYVENPIGISIASSMTDALRILRKDKKVRSISIREGELLILYEGTEKEEGELLRALVTEGVLVRSFHRDMASIDALFRELPVKREERRFVHYEAESDFS